jgi:hypothetical protein
MLGHDDMMKTGPDRPQWLKTILGAVGGAFLGFAVTVIGDILFWCGMALLTLIGFAPGVGRDQAGTLLWSQVWFSFAIAGPLGLACGAVTGVYRSFIKD